MTRASRTGSVLLLCCAAWSLALSVRAAPTEAPERWRITGQPTADGCGGEIVLAARHLRFSGDSMFADVVRRTYRYERRGNRRRAEGTFRSEYECAGTRLYERWELEQRGPDVLVGELASTWHLAPRCEPCTVRFRIRAVRVRGTP